MTQIGLEDPPLSDDVVMYSVKVVECAKAYPHDFTTCPWLHPGERARRRDPKTCSYSSTLCPDVKKDKACARGANCPYSHNIFEYFLHPDRYRTRMCDFGDKCTRKLCFFAHDASQLRVTAKSLAAQQAQASSGTGKGKQPKQAGSSRSHSSSANDLQGTSPGSPSAGAQPQTQPSAAAEELMRQLELLRVEDPTAAATIIMGLLGQLDIHPLSRAGRQGSQASSGSIHASEDQEGSQGSSPRTPAAYLPAAAVAAQRKDTAAGPSLGSPAVSAGAGVGVRALSCELLEAGGKSSGRLSVQEHIAAVMSGKQVPEQQHPRRDTSTSRMMEGYGLYSPAGGSAAPQAVGAFASQGSAELAAMHARLAVLQAMPGASLPQPLEVFGLTSPAASSNGGELLPGDLLSSAMQWGVPEGQLCNPQLSPAALMNPGTANTTNMCVASCGLPAQLQLMGFAQDGVPLSGVSGYGYGASTQSAAGFSGVLGVSGTLGCGGLIPLMGPDSGSSGETLGGLGSPLETAMMVGTPQLLPSPSAHAAAHAAAALSQARLQQQQQLLLLQQQQHAAASAPAVTCWGSRARGVGNMLGAGAAAGYGGNQPALVPCLTGLSA